MKTKVFCRRCKWHFPTDSGDYCHHSSNLVSYPTHQQYGNFGCELKNKYNLCEDYERSLTLTERLKKFFN